MKEVDSTALFMSLHLEDMNWGGEKWFLGVDPKQRAVLLRSNHCESIEFNAVSNEESFYNLYLMYF